MIVSTPPCTHAPLPVQTVAVDRRKYGRMTRPYATIIAQVDSAGHVTATQVDDSSGDTGYDEAAQKAMQGWSFLPAAQNCKPVAGVAEYVVGAAATSVKDPCNHESTVLAVITPDYPDEARREGIGRVSVDVRVTLDPVGRLVKIGVVKSSGNTALDLASQRAAMQSDFFPKVAQCLPREADYIYSVTFDPNG